jgi:YidC/Oxa1 family membrane protein insertase
MEKNTILAVLLSTIFIVVWMTFFMPKQPKPAPVQETAAAQPAAVAAKSVSGPEAAAARNLPEREITVETKNFKAVFSTRGAAVKSWLLKERNGQSVQLALTPESRYFSTFPGVNFSLASNRDNTLVFQGVTSSGFRVTKTYSLSDQFLHKLKIDVSGPAKQSGETLAVALGPGLGTDEKEMKENEKLTRMLSMPAQKGESLKVLKLGEYPAGDFKWSAIDNRYFLAAVIPAEGAGFEKVIAHRAAKNAPMEISLSKKLESGSVSMQFYMGPKGYVNLKNYGYSLDESVDFGWFGFLGKLALRALNYLSRMTGNYGWAIILLTILLQALVMPLSIKSFEASAAMKRMQPKMKELQEKFKGDAKRLNIETMNLYKTEKVNPLGGCLPMILQLPIFWALFTTLRNAYELRGAHWIWWIKDLSKADTFFTNLLHLPPLPLIGTLGLLPLLMGVGMFVQQQMVSVTTDPAQAKMMYIIPVVFTFMFMGFPSGLVLYWLVNSMLTMIEQYFFIHRPEQKRNKFNSPQIAR